METRSGLSFVVPRSTREFSITLVINRLGLGANQIPLSNSSNGNTPGITQPSADCQEAVVRKAYSKAGLNFADSDYIECHGTGTAVGDPIEVEALGRCFGDSKRSKPLLLGSVS